jgi:hypothetical protein
VGFELEVEGGREEDEGGAGVDKGVASRVGAVVDAQITHGDGPVVGATGLYEDCRGEVRRRQVEQEQRLLAKLLPAEAEPEEGGGELAGGLGMFKEV